MYILLFQETAGITSLIQTLGFPIAVAIMLLWFAWKVWQNMTEQVKAKDELIKQNVFDQKTFSTSLLESQQKINTTLETHKDIFTEIKDLLTTTKER
jgi:hypothetical protein